MVVQDFGIQISIAGAVESTIWSKTVDNAAGQLAKYESAILTALGKKFVHLDNRIKRMDPQHSIDIKEILFNNEFPNQDKVGLLKIKIQSVLKNLNGSKRKQFIFFVIAMILFTVDGNFSLFV